MEQLVSAGFSWLAVTFWLLSARLNLISANTACNPLSVFRWLSMAVTPWRCHTIDWLIAVKRSFPAQYGSSREGLAGRGYTTRRTATCEKLYELVGERGYLLIKAPPQSGKTSILQLVMDWASRERPHLRLVYINLADERTGFELNRVLQTHAGGTLDEIINGRFWGNAGC